MNAFVAKEMRLLLPGWAGAAAMAVLPMIVFADQSVEIAGLGPAFVLAFAMVLLGLTSFGREFNLHTFAWGLSQPIERSSIWRMKMATLLPGAALVFAVWLIGMVLFMPRLLTVEVTQAALVGAVTGLTSGLWSSLLVRQVVGAFWVAMLVPGVIISVLGTENGWRAAIALLLYTAGGFWAANKLFWHAQETGWASNVVQLPRLKMSDRRSQARHVSPLSALLAKELKLHQSTLIAIVWLAVLHVAVLFVRGLLLSRDASGDSLQSTLENFGGLWALIPLVAGAMSIAEERKLGTLQGQVCQPVSTRVQLLVKLGVVVLLGGIVSPLLLWVIEGIRGVFGVWAGFGPLGQPFQPGDLAIACVLFSLFAFAGFYASSMARNIVQALVMAVVLTFAAVVVMGLGAELARQTGRPLWAPELFYLFAWPAILITAAWLTLKNYRSAVDHARFWPRNIFGWAICLGATALITAGVFHRVWERFVPLEAPPGAAQLDLERGPVSVRWGYGPAIAALLPDGRCWVGAVTYDPGNPLVRLKKKSLMHIGGGWHSTNTSFLPGENWVDVALSYREAVAIREDGTLWSYSHITGPVQFGTDKNWLQVIRIGGPSAYALLKKDGTLWHWGTEVDQKDKSGSLTNSQPQRAGTKSDWDRMETVGLQALWDKAGEAWRLSRTSKRLPDEIAPGYSLHRFPALDGPDWQSISAFTRYQHRSGPVLYIVGVKKDGSLWGDFWVTSDEAEGAKLIRIGTITNWLAISGNETAITGLKSDGTLWRFDITDKRHLANNDVNDLPVRRLGSRSDWVGAGTHYGNVSLAADGTLWFWPVWDYFYNTGVGQPLLGPSRRPSLMANILQEEHSRR